MSSQSKSPNHSCLFCSMPVDRIVASNNLAYAVKDGFPVTAGHALVIPKRHVVDFFGLSDDEVLACNQLLKELHSTTMGNDELVEGFNVGMNAGEAAGQTIFHCHIHLIPRRKGDIENPRGGVRHTIPGKGFY